MTYRQASILMAAVVVARSTAFLFSKMALLELAPFMLLAARFLLSFLVLALVFGKHLRQMGARQVAHGAVLGLTLASLMTCEMYALGYTKIGTVSFLENTAVVFVPLITCIALRHRPAGRTMACAGLALAGVFVMTTGEGGISGFGPGEALSLTTALLYAVQIILTGRYARTDDPIGLGAVQLGAAGVFCLAGAALTGGLAVPHESQTWVSLAVLALVCGAFGFAFQPLAQRVISAEQAGLTCVLSPVCAALWGFLFAGEPLGAADIAGAVLILSALVLPVASTLIGKRAPRMGSSGVRAVGGHREG